MTTFTALIAKKNWNAWSQFAVWTGTVIGMFLMDPPVLTVSGQTGTDIVRFVQFVFAILAGIAFQARDVHPLDKRRWRVAAVVLAVMATTIFFAYQQAEDSWTCPFAVRWHVVKSEDYTEDARKTAEKLPGRGLRCAEVLQEYGGAAELVWDRSQARTRYLLLNLLYLGLWMSSAFALVTAIQSWTAQGRTRVAAAPAAGKR